MRVEQEITVGRPVTEVFAYLADGEALTEWMDDFAEVKKLTEGPVARGTTYRYVRKRPRAQSTWQWAEYQPHRRLEWHGPPVRVGLGRVEPRGDYDAAASRPGFGAWRLPGPAIARSGPGLSACSAGLS